MDLVEHVSPVNWSEQVVLITGGTGCFGRKFVERMLHELHPKKLIVFSRDESKQYRMRASGLNHPSLHYFAGDIRDAQRVQRALSEVTVLIHAVTVGEIPDGEGDAFEAIQTNVLGLRNVIEAAIDRGVQRFFALSTDQAVNPVTLGGATQLCAEKMLVQANSYSGGKKSRFSCVRYQSTFRSSAPLAWLSRQNPTCGEASGIARSVSRFWVELDAAVQFVIRCIEQMDGGEIFVPKLPSVRLTHLHPIGWEREVPNINLIAEKSSEILISQDEALNVIELQDMYVIQPMHPAWHVKKWNGARPVPERFCYSSDDNLLWLRPEELTSGLHERSFLSGQMV